MKTTTCEGKMTPRINVQMGENGSMNIAGSGGDGKRAEM
jgi:hypothetical protein